MDINIIKKLAASSKIELTAQEEQDLGRSLNAIVAWLEQIKTVDISKAPQESALGEVLREDKISVFPAGNIINAFPASEENMDKVKKVL